jgi:NADH:ubiquinone oxidoreductase subunit E
VVPRRQQTDSIVPDPASRTILVCVNRRLGHAKPSCAARGSEALAGALEAAAAGTGVAVVRLKCFGRCAEGPNVRIEGGPFFRGASVQDVPLILARAMHVEE